MTTVCTSAIASSKTITISTPATRQAEEMACSEETFLLCGSAGTGKSTLIRKIATKLGKNCVVLSTTAASAINVGGVTVHSFFCLPYVPWTRSEEITLSSGKIDAIKAVKTIIIDEVSMLRCDLVDAIDHILRKVTKCNLPFGGKQIIFCGDLLQLPPIVTTAKERAFFKKEYDTAIPSFFKAHVFKNYQLPALKLNKNFRQSDSIFNSILNDVRKGAINYARLNLLNRRVATPDTDSVVLTPDNRTATEINHRRLESINSPLVSYTAATTGDFSRSAAPVDAKLMLKEGAQVMFCSNSDNECEGSWRNGEVGTIEHLAKDSITVRKENGEVVNVMRHKWTQYDFEYKRVPEIVNGVATGKMIGSVEKVEKGTFSQFPLRMGWAITIHKSMGLTLKKAHLCFTNYFMTGQLYVALSRVRNIEDLTLERKIWSSLIQPHPIVAEFKNNPVLKAAPRRRVATKAPVEAAA